jgi:hypothetical protein
MSAISSIATPHTAHGMSDEFSEDLFEALGAGNIPEEDKAILLLQIIEVVQTRVLNKAYDALNDEQRQKLGELMESDQEGEKIEEYLLEAVPTYYQMFEEEAKLLRRQLVSRMVAA